MATYRYIWVPSHGTSERHPRYTRVRVVDNDIRRGSGRNDYYGRRIHDADVNEVYLSRRSDERDIDDADVYRPRGSRRYDERDIDDADVYRPRGSRRYDERDTDDADVNRYRGSRRSDYVRDIYDAEVDERRVSRRSDERDIYDDERDALQRSNRYRHHYDNDFYEDRHYEGRKNARREDNVYPAVSVYSDKATTVTVEKKRTANGKSTRIVIYPTR
ncbi:uncharacterized protein PV07_00875 [Cladophialophora immunda]|uniref:Uncharacterized protein n=1 Tax=Cladophialophora immunda TaxID=569365 RepID=A0A0D2CW60_9EURO|nr:uncharacterized protein PV07_00875 [Cladophialophora immunda]KIW34075.1 hypothetical protein PV07_00875 [Cladophialophora immunda]OQV03021.1 hypothetical protein CLAIMM_08121 [Cladophialophora immunda]